MVDRSDKTEKLCECGCGTPAAIATKTSTKGGRIKGEPTRFAHGHNNAKSGVHYVVQDQGYLTPCRVWQRSKDSQGYGHMRDAGEVRSAHIVYYEREHGPVPGGLTLDHLCHNPKTCCGGKGCPHRACINSDHLEPVVSCVNVQRGVNTKLTAEQVRLIRSHCSLRTHTELAEEFGVSRCTIWKIATRATWRQI